MERKVVINGVTNPDRLTFTEIKKLADDPGVIFYGKDDFLSELKNASPEGVFIYMEEYTDTDVNDDPVVVRAYEHRYPDPVKSSDVLFRLSLHHTKRNGALEILFMAENRYD